jgi:hypothetical protein
MLGPLVDELVDRGADPGCIDATEELPGAGLRDRDAVDGQRLPTPAREDDRSHLGRKGLREEGAP